MRLRDGKLSLSATDLDSFFEREREMVFDAALAHGALELQRQSEIER